MRTDLSIIYHWIPEGAKVLDLGCGEGLLLKALIEQKGVQAYGVDIEHHNIIKCVNQGVNVLQADMEQGLQGFADKSFDVAVLSQTLQALHDTESTLREMMRVAKMLVVTLPNFGFWKQRWQLMMGRMPTSKALPYQWFNTPNVRYCTIDDFKLLCVNLELEILERKVLDDEGGLINLWPNMMGSVALYRLSSETHKDR